MTATGIKPATIRGKLRRVLSVTVTHTHYTAGGNTYGSEADARATGMPVRKCEWLDVLYEGLPAPRFKTRWSDC